MAQVQDFFANFNAADLVWVAGAVLLGILAIKVAAKIFKFLLGAAVVVLLLVFLFSSGILPPIF